MKTPDSPTVKRDALRSVMERWRSKVREKDQRISQLAIKLSDEQRKSRDLELRLGRLVRGRAWVPMDNDDNDVVAMELRVSRQVALYCGVDIWKEAIWQLLESLKREIDPPIFPALTPPSNLTPPA